MLRKLLLTTTAILSFATNSFAEGVHLNGGTYLINPGLYINANPSPTNSSGICSYWYSAPTTAKRQATIISSYPNYSLVATRFSTGVLIEHYPVGTNMELHVLIQRAGAVNSQLDFYFTTPLHYWTTTETPSDKTSVVIYWDSNQGLMRVQINGNFAPINTARSSTTGVPFSLITNDSVNKVAWTVGTKLIQTASGLTPTQFFTGDLNQVYCHFDDNDYTYINAPKAISPTSGNEFPIFFRLNPANGQRSGPYPLNMGLNCSEVLPDSYNFPHICMRGNPSGFASNGGNWPFQVIPSNGLTDAVYDPFDLLLPTDP